MSTIASATIKASIKPNATKKEYALDITGRGTSVLGGKNQGDHVTAYSLVEEGLCRALSGLNNDEVDKLFKLGNRESLRDKRSKLYDFVSAIAILDPTQSENLYSDIDRILKKYNKKRDPKTELREETKEFQEDPSLVGKNLTAALAGIEMRYNKNGEHIRETFTEITRAVLTFYNHIPGTSYFAIPGFEASSDEGSIVRTTKPVMERAIKSCEELDDSVASDIKRQKHLRTTITSVADLIHYPEITDEDALTDHESYTETYGAKRRPSKSRNNTEADLVDALAKHLHITFAVYPELDNLFEKDDIIKPFVSKMIKGKKDDEVLWPSYNRNKHIERIFGKVKNKLNLLQEKLEEGKYTSRDAYDDLVSSDDEDEPTKPRVKKKPVIRKEPELPDTALQEELERLRRLEKFMLEGMASRDIILSPQSKKDLAKEFPSLGIKKEKEK